MKFEENTAITDIDGDLTIQGSNCNAGRIFLASENGSNVWDIAASGATIDIDYIDVEYSTASPGLSAENSTEGTGNTGWTVTAGECGAKEVRIKGDTRIKGDVRIK